MKKHDGRPKTFNRLIPNLSGEGKRRYEYVSLSRREAVEVAHNSLTTLLAAVSTVASALFEGEGSRTAQSKKEFAENIVSALSGVKFETLWNIARVIFRGAVIDEATIIEDLDESDYFDDRIDEFYVALALGIEGNYPSVFSRVRGLLKDFDLPADVKAKLGMISND